MFCRERERERFGPKKRGPKPETFLLKAKAKSREQPYEFRRDTSSDQGSYACSECVITPRAREGLRAVVPTIYPPSAVNRGETVPVQFTEQDRRHRRPSPHEDTVPRKRGRKPKVPSENQEVKHSRSLEDNPKTRRLQYEGTTEHTLSLLTKRFEEETTITPKSSASFTCTPGRTADSRTHFVHRMSLHPLRHRPIIPALSDRHEHAPPADLCSSWRPTPKNLDAVTVTDVTMNFLTVTILESSTAQGFFRDKR